MQHVRAQGKRSQRPSFPWEKDKEGRKEGEDSSGEESEFPAPLQYTKENSERHVVTQRKKKGRTFFVAGEGGKEEKERLDAEKSLRLCNSKVDLRSDAKKAWQAKNKRGRVGFVE